MRINLKVDASCWERYLKEFYGCKYKSENFKVRDQKKFNKKGKCENSLPDNRFNYMELSAVQCRNQRADFCL